MLKSGFHPVSYIILAILVFLYVLIQKKHLINAQNIKDERFEFVSTKAISIFRNSHCDLKLKIWNIKHLMRFITKNLSNSIPLNYRIFSNCLFFNLKSVQ